MDPVSVLAVCRMVSDSDRRWNCANTRSKRQRSDEGWTPALEALLWMSVARASSPAPPAQSSSSSSSSDQKSPSERELGRRTQAWEKLERICCESVENRSDLWAASGLMASRFRAMSRPSEMSGWKLAERALEKEVHGYASDASARGCLLSYSSSGAEDGCCRRAAKDRRPTLELEFDV